MPTSPAARPTLPSREGLGRVLNDVLGRTALSVNLGAGPDPDATLADEVGPRGPGQVPRAACPATGRTSAFPPRHGRSGRGVGFRPPHPLGGGGAATGVGWGRCSLEGVVKVVKF